MNFAIMRSWLKPTAFAACLIPFGQLAYNAYIGDLGVNPIDTITRFTGSWALIFLLTCLAVTPLRRITGWNELIKFRRMLGLFAFSYALTHFATYLVLDHFFNWPAIGKDILKRPYVTAGFTALERWQQLHRLVYVAAIAGVIHFYWLVKADIRRPAQYGFVLALLLGYRVAMKWVKRKPAAVARKSAVARAQEIS